MQAHGRAVLVEVVVVEPLLAVSDLAVVVVVLEEEI
jgi:hypothetical protein